MMIVCGTWRFFNKTSGGCDSMKRFRVLLAGSFLASVIAGCDSGGLKEGMDTEAATGKAGAPPSFQKEMERNAGKMGMVKQAPILKTQKAPKAAPEQAPEK
jgi:hypothetical protein